VIAAPPFRAAFDPARYPPGYLRQGLSEAKAQELMLQLLELRKILAVPVDAGARNLRGRAVGALRARGVRNPEALLAGRTGTAAGVVDIIGALPGGCALFIEMKRPAYYAPSAKTGRLVQVHAAGAPTEEQLRFLTAAHQQGAVAGVAWGPTDLDEILERAA
jgi:hypothetical protein